MKFLKTLALALTCTAALSACKGGDSGPDPAPVAPYGKVQVSFSNEVDGQPITMGPLNYTNAAGNKYSVDLLKYYITNFTLVKADGREKKFNVYRLIDQSNPASYSFTLDSVLNGDYTSAKFYLGVDSAHNHSLAQEGDLDPTNGMVWSWSTGYIFFKHEGNYIDSNGATKPLLFHYGTDAALKAITVPMPKLTVAGATRKLYLKFNLNSAYTTPGNINFNADNLRMSDRDDVFWLVAMSGNFSDAFQYGKAE